ncbi:MAG: hypothetical protein E7551_03025 [Ruminococcaceae bacterium]|nr:hypothetical protein [Oscillospiraceae bacterium]
MPENNTNYILTIMLLVFGIIVLLVLLVNATIYFKDFSQELKYIKMEIERSEGSERRYWIRQKRKLWLSLLPFMRY